MRIERLVLPDGGERELRELAERLRALVPQGADVAETVAEIVADVARRGDAAVLEHTSAHDTAGAPPRPLLVPAQELDAALERMQLEVVAGLQVAIVNVARLADAALGRTEASVQMAQGHTVAQREIPLDSAAVYAPGGRAAYPSTVVMGVVTARAAGVLDVAVCTPPGPDGQAHEAILAACRLCGVERVYRMGGAQAIAALAHGTESVRRVDAIVGPGSLYVQEAKRQLCGLVGIDGFAGPSDLLVAFGADAPIELVALDVLAQAEHGAGSLVVAVCGSPEALDALHARIESELIAAEREPGDSVCVLVQSAGAEQSLALANAFAPEHLQLMGADEQALAPRVRTAGCLFVGPASATAFGDYVAGSNHVLPTGGAARFSSTLSPRHFRRTMSVVEIGEQAAVKLAKAGAPIARAEGFPLHARSMQARIGENRQR